MQLTAGLTLPYSSGSVVGNVNRIKMIKRQMYGPNSALLAHEAGCDLLPIVMARFVDPLG
ncbi:hypothetical protein [Actinoplanes sp. DH11]|uniref:hypothetical protein n=1 Tax=Actinoplanes sp. DH11 TaxID=2857011 RepID=UPI001E4DEDE0|nr:hypothetical protein [Actinoplanes sp. DH11]